MIILESLQGWLQENNIKELIWGRGLEGVCKPRGKRTRKIQTKIVPNANQKVQNKSLSEVIFRPGDGGAFHFLLLAYLYFLNFLQ